jgi:hypothetical protein
VTGSRSPTTDLNTVTLCPVICFDIVSWLAHGGDLVQEKVMVLVVGSKRSAYLQFLGIEQMAMHCSHTAAIFGA